MRVSIKLVFICILSFGYQANAQIGFDSVQFFKNDKMLTATLSTDLSNLLSGRIKDEYQKATFTCKLPDSSMVTEDIRLNARGHMRRSICAIPPIRLSFKNASSPKLSSLGTLKLVNSCKSGGYNYQLLLKEYLIYKIYNVITDLSFRARLVNMTYEDNKAKKKSFTQYAFFVENVDAMAKRNKRKEGNNIKITSNEIEKEEMTMVDLFEFMIGNTDWSVPNNHNIKLLLSKKDSTAKPYAVPYDFDFSGFVNADYASPDPMMDLENVVQRRYRGFPRTMNELKPVLQIFKDKKDQIYAIVNQFELLDKSNRKDIINYMDDFYRIINNPKEVQYTFIDNARTK